MVAAQHQNGVLQFPGKNEQETFQFYFHQHWIRLLAPFLRCIAYNILWIVSVWMLALGSDNPGSRHLALLFLIFIFLVIHIGFMIRFYNYFLYAVIVTDRRIHRIKKTLMSIDDQQIVDLAMLQDTRKSQHGIFQNIFHFGSLTLEAQDTEMRLHFIPNIEEIHERILHLHAQLRTRL